MATSYEDAVVRAVEFYLERLDEGGTFEYFNPSGFNNVIERFRNDPRTLFSALFDYPKELKVNWGKTREECPLLLLLAGKIKMHSVVSVCVKEGVLIRQMCVLPMVFDASSFY